MQQIFKDYTIIANECKYIYIYYIYHIYIYIYIYIQESRCDILYYKGRCSLNSGIQMHSQLFKNIINCIHSIIIIIAKLMWHECTVPGFRAMKKQPNQNH